MAGTLKAGAAIIDITPKDSQFLFGYPHVKRYSTGVHDPLLSSALYISNGPAQAIFIANDIIFVSRDLVRRARQRINELTGVLADNIMITATHTHSGPVTVDYISSQADTIIPKADPAYLKLLEDGIVTAASQAFKNIQPAQIGLALADSTGIGTNRRAPDDPADMQVPVLMVRSPDGKTNIACMLICSMHPTVLHEDSTLISGDFPAMARLYLQKNILGSRCPVLHHTGPSGNQSPRHVTKANTFQEAQRLGKILAHAVAEVFGSIEYKTDVNLSSKQAFTDLPRKTFPTVKQARDKLDKAEQNLEYLRKTNASRQQIRTAECDWFGAEETLTLAHAAQLGRLQKTYDSLLPAEIQVIKIGPWKFVAWQGEIFTEYALAVKQKFENTFVISLANGELQGYITTAQAATEGGYEASNALFSHDSGKVIVDKTLEILDNLK